MATESQLLKRLNETQADKRPVLRIVPSNALQAEKIAGEIHRCARGELGDEKTNQESKEGTDAEEKKLGALEQTVAIFRGTHNPLYSKDLGDMLRRKVEPGKPPVTVTVIFDGVVGPGGPGTYVTDSVAMLNPDYVVFLGMVDTAVPLVRQLRIMQRVYNDGVEKAIAEAETEANGDANKTPSSTPARFWRPSVFLSDGSVDMKIKNYASLEKLSSEERSGNGVGPAVRGFFPHGSQRLHWNSHVPDQTENDSDSKRAPDGPSYRYFGHDAALIAAVLLKDAQKASKNAKESVTRQGLRSALQDLLSELKEETIVHSLDEHTAAGKYRFDDNGDPVGLDYHIWQLGPDGWEPAEEDPVVGEDEQKDGKMDN